MVYSDFLKKEENASFTNMGMRMAIWIEWELQMWIWEWEYYMRMRIQNIKKYQDKIMILNLIFLTEKTVLSINKIQWKTETDLGSKNQ